MSELQERLQKFGTRQAVLLGRLVVALHRDILKLLSLAWQGLVNAFIRTGELTKKAVTTQRSAFRGASDADILPRDKGHSSELEDRRADLPARVTHAPAGQCIYAIGDVHGRYDLLLKLLDKIDADIADLPEETEVILVFLGDYIDRGLQSRQVFDLLMSDRMQAYTPVFLMGNHEESVLRFREDATFGREWARFGGGETLYSYGLQPPSSASGANPDAWHAVWSQFREVFPPAHLDFVQSMQHYVIIGDYLFVHAGLRPNVAIEDQSVDDMLWIRDTFLTDDETFPYLVVHGHTPAHAPYIDNRRMGLDTGAFSSGILTAAKFFGTDIGIIKTG